MKHKVVGLMSTWDERRAPCGARGLKPQLRLVGRLAGRSRPVRGAWIET